MSNIFTVEFFAENGENVAEFEIGHTEDNSVIYRENLNSTESTEWEYITFCTPGIFEETAKAVADRLLKTLGADTYSFAE